MYHVTTNAPAVRSTAQDRHDLIKAWAGRARWREDSTISFTDNEDIAHDIHRRFMSMRQVGPRGAYCPSH